MGGEGGDWIWAVPRVSSGGYPGDVEGGEEVVEARRDHGIDWYFGKGNGWLGCRFWKGMGGIGWGLIDLLCATTKGHNWEVKEIKEKTLIFFHLDCSSYWMEIGEWSIYLFAPVQDVVGWRYVDREIQKIKSVRHSSDSLHLVTLCLCKRMRM